MFGLSYLVAKMTQLAVDLRNHKDQLHKYLSFLKHLSKSPKPKFLKSNWQSKQPKPYLTKSNVTINSRRYFLSVSQKLCPWCSSCGHAIFRLNFLQPTVFLSGFLFNRSISYDLKSEDDQLIINITHNAFWCAQGDGRNALVTWLNHMIISKQWCMPL